MRVRALGENAVMVLPELASGTLAERAAAVISLARALAAAHPGADVVPGGTQVLVVGAAEPAVKSEADAWEARAAALDREAERAPSLHVLDVVYDGEDLAEIAARSGRTRAEVVALHTEREYVALVAGFLPGFAYLGELAPELVHPRRASPRAAVPEHSVAIAGAMTGVYPFASPGGWHLLGRALDPRLFDPTRDPARRIQSLDRVRFVEVQGATPPEVAPSRSHGHSIGAGEPGRTALMIEGGTPFASVQDRGRFGRMGEGIPRSGALDPDGLASANRAVGNDESCAGIEVPLGNLVVRARGELVVAVDGGAAQRMAEGEAFEVRAVPGRAVRTLAVRGGIDVPLVLGSRSTLAVARLGGHSGRALRRGDVLPVGTDAGPVPAAPQSSPAPPRMSEAAPLTLEIRLAGLDPRIDDATERSLFSGAFALSARSNRIGFRLDGDRLPRLGDDGALPEPVMPGIVQITTDGGIIVLGPDAAVTGGYPILGVVTPASLASLGRALPGRPIRFSRC